MKLPHLLLAALLAAMGCYFYGHHKGWAQRDAEMQVEIARKNEEARTKEQSMAQAVADKDEELRKANTNVAQKQTDLNRIIAAGRVRISAPGCVQTSPGAATASGNRDEAGSQPDRSADAASDTERQTLAAIAEIVAQGDRNTAQLNACVDAYNAVRNTVNDHR